MSPFLAYLADGGDDLQWWAQNLSSESQRSRQPQKGSIRSLVEANLTQLQQAAGQSPVMVNVPSAFEFTKASAKSSSKRRGKKKSTKRRKAS